MVRSWGLGDTLTSCYDQREQFLVLMCIYKNVNAMLKKSLESLAKLLIVK
jgi:hypothetical protein